MQMYMLKKYQLYDRRTVINNGPGMDVARRSSSFITVYRVFLNYVSYLESKCIFLIVTDIGACSLHHRVAHFKEFIFTPFLGASLERRLTPTNKMATLEEKGHCFVWLAENKSVIVVQCNYRRQCRKEPPSKPTMWEGTWRLAVCYSDNEVDGPLSAMSVSNRCTNRFVAAYDNRFGAFNDNSTRQQQPCTTHGYTCMSTNCSWHRRCS